MTLAIGGFFPVSFNLCAAFMSTSGMRGENGGGARERSRSGAEAEGTCGAGGSEMREKAYLAPVFRVDLHVALRGRRREAARRPRLATVQSFSVRQRRRGWEPRAPAQRRRRRGGVARGAREHPPHRHPSAARRCCPLRSGPSCAAGRPVSPCESLQPKSTRQRKARRRQRREACSLQIRTGGRGNDARYVVRGEPVRFILSSAPGVPGSGGRLGDGLPLAAERRGQSAAVRGCRSIVATIDHAVDRRL